MLLQSLRRSLEVQYPHIAEMWSSVTEPVYLARSEITLDIPKQVPGWSIIPDRTPVV